MGARPARRWFHAPLALTLSLLAVGATARSAPVEPSAHGADRSATARLAQSATAGTGSTDASRSAGSVTQVTSQGAGDIRPAVRVAGNAAGSGAPTASDSHVARILIRAYQSAADKAPARCHLTVSLLAAIGEVESGSLAGRTLDSRHRTRIFGPVLNGHGVAAVRDTDHGRWDGNRTWDLAVGPMQFIPSTWRTFGVDGDGDGVADPQDVEDAAASTAAYLCYGGRDLSDHQALGAAVLSYNHSTAYRDLVLTYQKRYARLGLDDLGSTGQGVQPFLDATPVYAEPVTLSSTSAPSAVSSRSRPVRHTRQRHHGDVVRAAGETTTRITDRSQGLGSHVTGSGGATVTGTPSPVHTAKPSPVTTPVTTPVTKPSGHPTSTPTGTTTGTPVTTCTPVPTGSVLPTASPTGPPSLPPSPSPTSSTDPAAPCPPCSTDPGDASAAGTPTATATTTATATATTTAGPAGTAAQAGPDGTTATTCPVDPVTTASPSSAP